jgi:hypothetical protein
MAQTFEAQVAQMSRAVKFCRSFGHQLNPTSVSIVGGRYRQELECIRCGVVAEKVYDSRGRLVSSKYVGYPDGYLLEGTGVLDRDERGYIRLQAILEQ